MFKEIECDARSLSKRKKVYGVGINDANYFISRVLDNKRIECPYYTVWSNMLMRCYSESFLLKNPAYKNCIVKDEWHTFSKFKKWMQKQNWKNNELDKDLIKLNNKIYSSNTCVFVDRHTNNILQKSKKAKGYYFRKDTKKYSAEVSNGIKLIRLGCFQNEEDAKQAYLFAKRTILLKCANRQKDIRVKNTIKNVAYGALFAELRMKE